MSDDFRNTPMTSEPVQDFPGSSEDVTKTSEKSSEAVLITEQHVFRVRYCSILMIYYTDISPTGDRHATDMLPTADHKVAIDTSAECRPTLNV